MSSMAAADTIISSDTFPDPAFREYIRARIDTNSDDILQDNEIAKVEMLLVHSRNISSLEGIGVFTKLSYLSCSNNNIITLDLSHNPELGILECNHNNLTALDLSHNPDLAILDCRDNNLTALDLSHNPELWKIMCSDNPLTALNLSSNTKLADVTCTNTNLGVSGLNVSNSPELKYLFCDNCGLSELDISSNDNLVTLVCSGNNIRTLDLEGKTQLSELFCAGNPITESLDIHNIVYSQGASDTIDENSFFVIAAYVGENVVSSSIKGFDSKGYPVKFLSYDPEILGMAYFETEPAVVTYTYNTGIENLKLSVTEITENASNLAPCCNGIFEGVSSGDIITWKGVPYAKQPAGSLRWKAPQAPDEATEHFEAFTYAATPIQHYSATNPRELMPPQGEDCLALNVWNNSRDMSARKPVMVWVHGGAFNSGGTGNPDYDPQRFIEAHDDVVLVSVGYRVGLMGFIDFANSGLPGAENFPDSQNLGLLDVLQAMRWINQNIAAFGGDPENITVFGQSSGAAMISLLMAMPESVGLFQRAIIQSGAVSMTSSVEDCKALTQALVQVTGADTMDKLMALSSADLQAAAEKLQALTNFPERDGKIVAANPYEAFAVNSAGFDVLTGSMQNEVNYYALAMGGAEQFSQFVPYAYYTIVNGINSVSSEDAARAEEFVGLYMTEHENASEVEAMCAFLNDLLFTGPVMTQANMSAGSKYLYYWEYPSWIEGIGACHALDIPYVLNDNTNDLVVMNYNQGLASQVQDMWVNFAKTGSPSTSSLTWPEYDTAAMSTMIINEPLAVRNANLAEEYALVQPLMKYGISGRELIAALAGGTDTTSPDVEPEPESQDITPSPESQDVTPSPESQDVVPVSSTLGSASGGCNSGFMFPMMFAVILFTAKRKF